LFFGRSVYFALPRPKGDPEEAGAFRPLNRGPIQRGALAPGCLPTRPIPSTISRYVLSSRSLRRGRQYLRAHLVHLRISSRRNQLRRTSSSRNRSRRRRPLSLEALPAQHRPALRRLEWDRSLHPALRTLRPRLGPRQPSRGWMAANLDARTRSLRLARLAPFRVVLKLFVEKEELFAGGEDKFPATVCTRQ
jgi:hypothetical protein